MSIKYLERNLDRVWINIKENFRDMIQKSYLLSYWNKELIKEINIKVFIILNRSNYHRNKKDTSPITWMYPKNVWEKKLISMDNLENITEIKKISSSDIFKSITWMQNGKWMIKESDYNKLKEISFSNRLIFIKNIWKVNNK